MTRFDTDAIRVANPISSVIGSVVKLSRQGNQWMGCCPFHDDGTPSLSVSDQHGAFHCFGCGESGDVIGFVMKLEGVTFQEAVSRLDDGSAFSAPSPRPQPNAQLGKATRQRAEAIWREARPIGGTPVEEYLARRGLPLKRLPPDLPIRFARLRHPGGPVEHPALVAMVADTDGDLIGIQRTFLTEDGRKLDVPDPKLSLGTIKGGAIQIGGPEKRMIVCEGLEDGLSIALELAGTTVWVAAGGGNMAKMRLPSRCKVVTIAIDNDEAGERAAEDAAQAFREDGKQTRAMRPSPGVKDFNEGLIESLNQ